MVNASIVTIWFFSFFFVSILHKYFYIAICLYLKAFLSDWKDIITESNQSVYAQPQEVNFALQRKLIDAVTYHMKILEFVFQL